MNACAADKAGHVLSFDTLSSARGSSAADQGPAEQFFAQNSSSILRATASVHLWPGFLTKEGM